MQHEVSTLLSQPLNVWKMGTHDYKSCVDDVIDDVIYELPHVSLSKGRILILLTFFSFLFLTALSPSISLPLSLYCLLYLSIYLSFFLSFIYTQWRNGPNILAAALFKKKKTGEVQLLVHKKGVLKEV